MQPMRFAPSSDFALALAVICALQIFLSDVPGAVTDVHYRPSLKKQLTARIDAFTPAGKREFYALIEGEITPALVSNTDELETASQYFLYVKQKHGRKLPPEQLARMSGILSRRSQLGPNARNPSDQDELKAKPAGAL
jgi:hypothetical protein